MSYSGLAVVRVCDVLVFDPKFTVVNREVLPDRPTRVTPFKCELVRFALRRRIAHLNQINSGRAATAGIRAGASSIAGIRLDKHAPEVSTTPKTCFLKMTTTVVFGIRHWIAKECA